MMPRPGSTTVPEERRECAGSRHGGGGRSLPRAVVPRLAGHGLGPLRGRGRGQAGGRRVRQPHRRLLTGGVGRGSGHRPAPPGGAVPLPEPPRAAGGRGKGQPRVRSRSSNASSGWRPASRWSVRASALSVPAGLSGYVGSEARGRRGAARGRRGRARSDLGTGGRRRRHVHRPAGRLRRRSGAHRPRGIGGRVPCALAGVTARGRVVDHPAATPRRAHPRRLRSPGRRRRPRPVRTAGAAAAHPGVRAGPEPRATAGATAGTHPAAGLRAAADPRRPGRVHVAGHGGGVHRRPHRSRSCLHRAADRAHRRAGRARGPDVAHARRVRAGRRRRPHPLATAGRRRRPAGQRRRQPAPRAGGRGRPGQPCPRPVRFGHGRTGPPRAVARPGDARPRGCPHPTDRRWTLAGRAPGDGALGRPAGAW